MKVDALKKIAADHDWEFLTVQDDIGMVSFIKNIKGHKARINIYLSKMTVATCIKHPIKGKTQLFRKHVDDVLMRRIFRNPRVHTDKGYQRKGNVR